MKNRFGKVGIEFKKDNKNYITVHSGDPEIITKVITNFKTATASSSSLYPCTFTFPTLTQVVGITNLTVASKNDSEPSYRCRVNGITISGNVVTINMYHAPAANYLESASCTVIGY